MLSALTRFFTNERNVMIIISLNALIIFIDGFHNIDHDIFNVIVFLDHLFTVIFLIEMLVKIRHLGWKRYRQSNWNKLDFVLVTMSLPSLILAFTSVPFIDIEFLLIFRLCRIFKFFRFLRFVPGIEHLIDGVQRAIKSSVLVLIGFLVTILIISLMSTFMFREAAPEYFDNPLISFYTVFKIFTVEGWYEIPDTIAANSTLAMAAFARVFFSVILIVGGVLGLSLVNSIFVDSMISGSNSEIDHRMDQLNQKIDQLMEEVKSLKKGD
jgi:voltage-gated sodium channel